MMFFFLTSIGAAVVLQQRIQREYDGTPGFFERRKLKALVQNQFDKDNEKLDRELAKLLSQHRSLIRQDSDISDLDLYQQAMEELEQDLASDPLSRAFEILEKKNGSKKKSL